MNQEIYEKLKQITDEEAEILKGRQEVDMGRYVKPIEAGLSGGYVGMPDLDSSKLLESGKLILIPGSSTFPSTPIIMWKCSICVLGIPTTSSMERMCF